MAIRIELKSNRLQVEISQPGKAYKRTRFDWTGFITQVTLDGTHTFGVDESLHPGSGCGGMGLCNEFGIDTPAGFQEAKKGELFPKFGIGLLRKPNEKPYDFGFDYEIEKEFPTTVEQSADRAKITCEPLECNGYAVRLIKTMRVWENTLEVGYEFQNVGQKVIDTNEYIHNFIGIDHQPISSNYLLEFPNEIKHDENISVGGENLVITGNSLSFKENLPSLYFRPLTFSQSNEPQWTMQLKNEKVGLSETDSFAPVRIAVWGTFHVLSPEIFILLHVEPGQTQRWTRRYSFFD